MYCFVYVCRATITVAYVVTVILVFIFYVFFFVAVFPEFNWKVDSFKRASKSALHTKRGTAYIYI